MSSVLLHGAMNPNCMVTIPNGKLHGIKCVSAYSDEKYYQFLGIPYAEPPIGPRRFMPPKPAKRWSGTLDATKERDSCIQFSLFAQVILGSEDCLYLNVSTPQAPRRIKTPKPVLVQIHPGGHFWGSASRDSLGNPDFFIHHDVIFVTINYRLHVLGFLNLDLQNCRGNMGLKDQSMALKWVKDNISYFGGNPDNITVLGSSSAACDLHMHMMSPMSKDLFHRGILLGGYVLNSYWSYQNNHIERAYELADEMGFKGKTRIEVLKFLKKQDVITLYNAVERLKKVVISKNESKSEICLFRPTIEAFEEDAFMCKSPRELIKTAIPKPLISGITAEEGFVSFWVDPVNLMQKNLPKVVRENLWIYDIDEDMLETVCKEIRSFYFNDKPIDHTMAREICNLYTDMWYCEWQDWLDSVSSNSSQTPVYVYYFSHAGRLNYQQRYFSKCLSKDGPQITAACHGDDASYFMLYLVEENQTYPLQITPGDKKIIDYMTKLLTNFVKTGDPNDERFNGVHWAPLDAEHPSYLRFDEDIQIVQGRIHEERAAFWRDLVKRIKDHESKLTKVESET